MSVVVPGPNVVSQRRTSSAYPSSLASGAGTSSSHRSIGFQRCREIRQWLSFSARTIAPDAPSWVSTRGAIGTSPPHLVPGETETVPATSGTRARISVVVSPRSSPCRASRTARRASSSQRRAVLGQPGGGGVLGDPAELLVGDPGRGAPPRRRQQVAREDEQGAAHRELADQGAVLEQGRVDVRHRDPVDPAGHRQVDGRRLGGVQHGHGADGRLGVADPVVRGQCVPARDAVAALLVGEVTHPESMHHHGFRVPGFLCHDGGQGSDSLRPQPPPRGRLEPLRKVSEDVEPAAVPRISGPGPGGAAHPSQGRRPAAGQPRLGEPGQPPAGQPVRRARRSRTTPTASPSRATPTAHPPQQNNPYGAPPQQNNPYGAPPQQNNPYGAPPAAEQPLRPAPAAGTAAEPAGVAGPPGSAAGLRPRRSSSGSRVPTAPARAASRSRRRSG